MANNFRINGGAYISKAGHDSNDGLTPDTPKKSINSSIVATTAWIIGAGIYNAAGVIFNTGGSNLPRYADGKVIIDFNNSTGTTGNLGIMPHYDFHIRNSSTFQTHRANYTRCVFENVIITQSTDTSVLLFEKCYIINSSANHSQGVYKLLNSIVLNSNLSINNVTGEFKNTYINKTSTISIITNFQVSRLLNNNIQGVITLEGINYAIQDQLIGTPQDNGYAVGVEWLTEANLTTNGYTGTIIGWDAAVATCINRDPLFNDASKLDFTLQANSPHIGRAFDGISNIGGTEYSQSFYAGISNPNTLKLEGDADIDSTTNINDWVLQPTSTQGVIRAIVKVSDTTEELGEINYIGNYSFDSDQTGGTSGNFNVPDSKPVTNDYPDYTQTTSDATNTTSIVIAGHSYLAGQWIKVEGQYREIDSVDANTIYFLTAVRAIVLSGTDVQVGSFSSLAALNPNRLNMLMRTSIQDVNSGNWDDNATWDNNSLTTAGNYLAQEWNNIPMIDNLNGVGFGDDNYDSAFGNTIQAKYLDILIYLRDDYKS